MICGAAVILVSAEEASVRVICRRSYVGVCRGGVCDCDLWRRSYIGVCRGSVCESDERRRSYIGVCRGSVCVSDLCRRSYICVCRGGVSASDLCRRKVSVRVICGAGCQCLTGVSSKSALQEC